LSNATITASAGCAQEINHQIIEALPQEIRGASEKTSRSTWSRPTKRNCWALSHPLISDRAH
jgi:hypothetical protein